MRYSWSKSILIFSFYRRDDIFAFLLSTRAGGLGINLTAADTVSTVFASWKNHLLIWLEINEHQANEHRVYVFNVSLWKIWKVSS